MSWFDTINPIYYDDNDIAHEFDSYDDMLEFLKENDYDTYLYYKEQYFTKDDYDGKDYDTALVEAIDEQNNSF